QDISKTKVRTLRRRKSGHVGAVSRSDHADHATTGFGVDARATGSFSFDHSPCAAIGHQRREHRVVQLVAAAYRAISGQQGQAGVSEIAETAEHIVSDALVVVSTP